MKKCWFLLLFMLLATGVMGQSPYVAKIFEGEAMSLPYRILYPEPYDESKQYPLLLFLHGAGERGSDNALQLKHGSGLFASDRIRKQHPAIVVFPQCPAGSYWASISNGRNFSPDARVFDYSLPVPAPLQAAVALTRQLVKQGSVDPARVYVAGLSMGGMGAFEAVFRNPDLFAAALPICGGADKTMYDDRVKDTRFWIFHGADDPVVHVDFSRQMVSKLQENSVSVKYSEYPGVEHNSWDNAFTDPDFISWIFAQRRPH